MFSLTQALVANEFAWTCSLFLGTVFLTSSVLKIGYSRRFRDTLTGMELLPRSWTSSVAWFIVLLEGVLGLNLLLATATSVTGAIAVGMLALFVCVLCWYRWRGNKELACGCFADFEHKRPVAHLIVRNLWLMAFAVPLVIAPRTYVPEWQALHWVLAALTLAGLWLAWTGISQVLEVVALQQDEASAIP